MRTRQEILDDMNEGFYKKSHVSDANERLTIELMLDIREQIKELNDDNRIKIISKSIYNK